MTALTSGQAESIVLALTFCAGASAALLLILEGLVHARFAPRHHDAGCVDVASTGWPAQGWVEYIDRCTSTTKPATAERAEKMIAEGRQLAEGRLLARPPL